MNLEFPSDNEVAELIKQVKDFLNNPQIGIPTVGKYKKDFIVSDKDNNIEYVLHIHRSRLENRYSLHIRFKSSGDNLVRLDINSGNYHHNSDKTTVGKNHIHILKCRNEQKECYAYELNKIPEIFINKDVVFSMDDELSKAFENFIKFVNIEN